MTGAARKLGFPPGLRLRNSVEGIPEVQKTVIGLACDDGLPELLDFIHSERGWDFRNYKLRSLRRRISKRLNELEIASFSDYLSYLRQTPSELDRLISFMTVKVSEFFREPEVFHEVCQACGGMVRGDEGFRVWCCGCANGEEAYSIAMLLSECLPPEELRRSKVFATDIDRDSLERARGALYRPEFLRNVPAGFKEKYFFSSDGRYKVKYNIRNLVRFGCLDIVMDCPLNRIDVLFCRNLFIYFDKELQKRVFEKLDYSLTPGGVLVLGRSEVVPAAFSSRYKLLSKRMSIYRKVG